MKKVIIVFFILCVICTGIVSKAAEDVQEEKIVRVGYYDDNENFQAGYADDVRKSGYAYEYYQEIAKYTGWTYEYVYGSWNEIYEMLLNGEVDIVAGVSKLESRMQDMLFPDNDMGSETYYIYVPEDSELASGDAAALDGAQIGVKSNSYMQVLLKAFMEMNGIDCNMAAYSSLAERMQDLEEGKIDCVVTVENDMVAGLQPVYKIGTSDFYFAVNKLRPDLLEELNKAQEEILAAFPFYESHLQSKYFGQGVGRQKLTARESEWLAAQTALRVGFLKDYMPYCGYMENTEELAGILPEISSVFSDYMDVPFIFVGFDDYKEMLDALEQGELDMIFPTFSDLWYSENQNYTQTAAVVSARMCVVYQGEYQGSIYDRIAVSKGSPLQPFYLTIKYPDAEQVTYGSWKECLLAIQSGEVGCMLINSNLIYRYLNEYEEFSDLHIAELDDMVDFCFAVRRNDSILYSILNKGLHHIDETSINDALIRNSFVEPAYTLRYFLIKNIGLVSAIVIGFILLLILFFILYWKRIKREQKLMEEAYEKEKNYIADKEKKFNIIGSLSNIYTYTYYINLEEDIYQIITNTEIRRESTHPLPAVREKVDVLLQENIKEKYREELRMFLDLETLATRMQSVDSLSMEYETQQRGWFRGRFILVERDSQGKLLSAIYVIRDINEEKNAQEQAQIALKEAYEAANRANRAKSDFLARMSHDIRTPMNAIIGMTAIAATHIDDSSRVTDCLEKITSSGKHLLTLINEVLDMSKIESGRLELVEEEFNLHELVDNMLDMLRPQIEARGHALHVSVKNLEHEEVIGDSLHMQQVFVNIMGNAVKYTPQGGDISVFVTEKPVNKSNIGCYEFVFEDNGIGMSQEFLERIFEPFSRENETSSNHVQGTGLGLSIVSNIIHMMGGDIKVESTQGKGSKFTVTIYLKIQEEESISLGNIVDTPVLVVDDQQEACESTCKILSELDMKSEWVLSGREAVERVKAAQNSGGYFAVILDWEMPEMSGIDTAKAIQEAVGNAIPMIILSGHDWLEIEAEAKEVGINMFISKPLFKSRLTYLLKKLINGGFGEKNSLLQQIEEDAFAGKRILLAEDNEINAEIAKEVFGMAGVEAEWAQNGKEAVDMLAESEPGYYDMVFMDIQMPVMDGYGAARTIRAMERSDIKNIPIIAMTANAFAEDVRAAVDAGMNQHIAKPLDMNQLMSVLHKWMA